MTFNRITTHYPACFFFLVCCTILVLVLPSCRQNSREQERFFQGVFEKANTLNNAGREKQALQYVDSVFASRAHIPPFYQSQRYYLKRLFYYYKGHSFDSSSMYADSSIAVLEKYNLTQQHPIEYGDALNARGDYYYEHNEMDKAFEYYYRGRVAALQTKDSCSFANQSYHLGMICYRQKKYTDAISFFKQTILESSGCRKDSIIVYKIEEQYNNIALAFTQQKQYDSAAEYFHIAINYLKQESRKYGPTVKQFAEIATGVIYGNLAKVYMARNQPDTARILLLQSIAINSKPDYDNNDALYAEIQLAELYYNQHDLKATIATLEQLKLGLADRPIMSVDLRRRHLLYEYYNETGDAATALEYLGEYAMLRDSLEEKEKQLKTTDVSRILKSQEAQYEVQLLTKNNQLNRLYLGIAIGLSLLTIIIVVLVYVNYHRSRKNVKQLTTLNGQINNQKQDLEFAAAELRKMNRSKDQILHVVAHDLRNPVSGILALSDIVMSREEDNTQRESWEMINSTAQYSMKLINRLSEMGTENMQENTDDKERADINDLARQVTALLQYKAADKKQALKLSLSPVPVPVFIYKEKIWRVLSNLIVNAIKFSPAGTDIQIIVAQKGNNALAEIRDNGIGIPEHLQPYIFDMFTAAKRSGTEGETSFGLGLSICRQIVEEHSGRIWFESREGRGTSFFVELPLIQ